MKRTVAAFFNTYLIAKLNDALELVPMWKSLALGLQIQLHFFTPQWS
jgi:hypothetical protein